MIKKFLEFAIDRPVLNHIFMVLMVIVSLFAYQNIAKEIFPASTLDKISISGSYMGASADVLDKMAVKTLEDNNLCNNCFRFIITYILCFRSSSYFTTHGN